MIWMAICGIAVLMIGLTFWGFKITDEHERNDKND